MFEKFIEENKEFFDTVDSFSEDHFKDYIERDEVIDFGRKVEKMIGQLSDECSKLRAAVPLPEDMIYDADKSVNWNREQWDKNTKKKKALTRECRKLESRMYNAANRMIVNWIMYEWGYSKKVAEVVFRAAYESGHSCGISEVMNDADTYASFLDDAFEAAKEEKES